MKISKSKIKSLVAEAMQKTVLNEVKAKNWEEYIAVGKNEKQKNQRRAIMTWWKMINQGASLVALQDLGDEIPVNPSDIKYMGGYEGWVKWYMDCRQNSEAMKIITGGKRKAGPNAQFSPSEMIEYSRKFLPPQQHKKAKEAYDAAIVGKLIADMGLDQEKPQMASLDLNKKIDSSTKTLVTTIKDAAQKYKTDADLIDNTKVDNAVRELNSGDAMDRLAATKEVEKVLGSKLASEFLKAINLSKPSLAELKKSEKYQNALNATEKTELAKGLEKDRTSEKTSSDKKQDANESKMMNENKIRAIIRHELIKSMRK